MYKFVLVMSLLITTSSYAQDACSADKPVNVIPERRANKRIKKFEEKNNGLSYYTTRNEIQSISYSKATFLKLLDTITKNSNYDGFRVYFATFPVKDPKAASDSGRNNMTADSSDCFTLIYVPTKRGNKVPWENDTSHAHLDQLEHCFIVKDGEVKEFNAFNDKFISQWVAKYRVTRKPYFGYDGNAKLNKAVLSLAKRRDFDETESLWYDKAIIVNDKDGLMPFIACDNHNIDKIVTNFAGYLRRAKPWSYRLTLVFTLYPNKNSFITGQKKSLVVSYYDANAKTNADTGRPCPPPTGGCQEQGATLPLQQ